MNILSTENIRQYLSTLHFSTPRRWVRQNGELNKLIFQQDIINVLSQIPNFDFTLFDLNAFIQDISDTIIDLQGIDSLNISYHNKFNCVFLNDASIELFLDVHVSTKLIRFIQRYYEFLRILK